MNETHQTPLTDPALAGLCALCRGPLDPAPLPVKHCLDCLTGHHPDCFESTQRCGNTACPRSRDLPPPPSPPKKKGSMTLVEFMIIIGIIGVLSAIAVPNLRHTNGRSNSRACYANQKTIVGAVEMYNLDKNTKRTDFGVHFWDELKASGYLQSSPLDPGQGVDSGGNYRYTTTGNSIECVVHGPIQQ